MIWLNFAKSLLGVTFMSWLKNLLCKRFEGLLYGPAPELDSWGLPHSLLRRPKGKLCLLVIFSHLLSCLSSSCWDVFFPPGVSALLTHKSVIYKPAKTLEYLSLPCTVWGHGPDFHGETYSFRTSIAYKCSSVCACSRENSFTGHMFIESKYLSIASNLLNVQSNSIPPVSTSLKI